MNRTTRGKKLIQIDHKTWIEVDESVDKEMAITKFHKNQEIEFKSRAGRPKGSVTKPKI